MALKLKQVARTMLTPKTKKRLIVAAVTIFTIVVVIISCASPIGKYILESYVGPTVLGRQLHTKWVYVNPFTGYVHISGLEIYEPGGDSLTILKAEELNVHYNVLKTLTKNYEFTDADLVKPVGYIIQDHSIFNFNDLIFHFSGKKVKAFGPHRRHPAHINVLNFKITDGEFHYIEKSIPVNYYMKHVYISSSGKYWAVDSMHVNFAMESGPGTGTIKGDGFIDFYKLDYGIAAKIKGLDMLLLEQYLKDLANYASLRGIIDADVKSTGNFKDKLALHVEGPIEFSDFHVGKSKTVDIIAFDKLSFSIHDLTPRNYMYWFDSISCSKPYFVYERYDYLDNLRNMFGAKAAKAKAAKADQTKFNLIIEIGKYVKVLVKNFLQSSYKLDHFNIYDGDLKYVDYALREKFYIGAKPLFIHADSVNKDNKKLCVTIKTGLNPHGTFNANLSVNPATYEDFDLHYTLQRVPVALFNPYLLTYTSYPLDRGIIEIQGTTLVRNNVIHSDNHLLVLDTRVAGRVKKNDTKWIPMPLIMSLVRNPGNAIDISIPITGDMKSPHFEIWDVVGQVVKNIVIKPPYIGYMQRTKKLENVVEKSLMIKWELRNSYLTEDQEDFLQEMADHLQKNKDASIAITSTEYVAKEKEYILLYEAKKQYFLVSQKRKTNVINEEDSNFIDQMSVKDSGFVHYLSAQQGIELLYSVQEKADHLIGKDLVNARYAQLTKDREARFLAFFKANNTISQVQFVKSRDIIPFNGYSNYKIEYKGETPERLLAAYDDLTSMNSMGPRKRYAKTRRAKAGMLIDEKKLKGNKKT